VPTGLRVVAVAFDIFKTPSCARGRLMGGLFRFNVAKSDVAGRSGLVRMMPFS
jgi:hypothetical protein